MEWTRTPWCFLLLLVSVRTEVKGQNVYQDAVHQADVRSCSDSLSPQGFYTGSMSVTEAGLPCLRWTDFPDYVQQYPEGGLGAHSLCRNPDREPQPWCFYRQRSGAISWAYCDCNHGAARLVGGSNNTGHLEVYLNGQWGAVCDTHWTDRDASVVCRQLGLGDFGKALFHSSHGRSAVIHYERLGCHGNERSLMECPSQKFVTGDCSHGNYARMTCAEPEDGAVRLVGADGPWEGRLEIYAGGSWGTVCDDNWTELNTQVVCRQLGFSGAAEGGPDGPYEEGRGLILLDEVQCKGLERSLLDCSHSALGQHDCAHSEDVTLRCQRLTGIQKSSTDTHVTPPAELPVRLVAGETPQEGRVEVFLNGQWGSVCDDGWDDISASVVCRQLGFKGTAKARSMAYFGPGQGPIHLDNVRCSEAEMSLSQCQFEGPGEHNCRHSEDAGVICQYKLEPVHDSSASLQTCGLSLSKKRRLRRIIGGAKSLRGEWPWQVSLWLRSQSKGNHPLCGASLINSCWALSAAHCFKRFGTDPSRYLLRLGDYHTQEQDDFERTLSPERIIIHKKYQSQAWDYDIALVRLKGTEGNCVSFNPHTSAVCLPESSHKWDKRPASCVITGWGYTDSEYSRTLKQAWVPLLPSWKCKKKYGVRFTSRMLCAGSLSEHRRVDSCQGDSGGPLVCQGHEGRWVLTGVISWGHGCGNPAFPGVYTRVSRFLRWIDKVVNKP